MPRPKTADGRRVIASVRLSDLESAAIESACGDDRSAWMRAALLAAAGYSSAPPRPAVRSRHDVARAALASVTHFDPEPEVDECQHPAEKIRNGRCECGFDDFAA